VQRRILEYSGAPFKVVNIAPSDRSLVWRLSKKRYYQVPLLKDGRTVVFETDPNSQVIAKYLETKLGLGLFARQWDGVQRVFWMYIEDAVEGIAFKLNDCYYREFVPPREQMQYLRFKERKFGRGCLDQWFAAQAQLQDQLRDALLPFEQMLGTRPFLLDTQPRFVDFDLFGMLANFLYSGHYRLPAIHAKVAQWYERMAAAKTTPFAS
jgi:glutathione S-transferase